MPTILLDSSNSSASFNEQGTAIITHAFTDFSGTSMVPNTIVWSLLEADGTVVNSRQQVIVATPAASIDVVLSGDDLAILDSQKIELRYLVIEYTFDDSTYGNNLPGKEEVEFRIINLRKIA